MLNAKDIRRHPAVLFLESHRGLLGGLLIVGFAAYGIYAFNFLLVGDDWFHVSNSHERCLVALSVGRWTKSLIWHSMSHEIFSPSFSVIFTLLTWAVSTTLLATLFGASSPLEKFCGACLVMVNPILATHISFPSAHLPMAMGMLSAVLGVFYVQRAVREDNIRMKFKAMGCSSLLLSLALGTRPSLFLFSAVALIACNLRDFSKEPQESPHRPSLSKTLGQQVVLLLAGFLLWLIIWKSLQFLFQVENISIPGYAFLPSLITSTEDLLFTSDRLFSQLMAFLFQDQHLWRLPEKVAFLMILTLYVIFALKGLQKQPRGRTRVLAILTFIFLMAAILITPWMIGLIRLPKNSYRYTARLGLIPLYGFFVIQLLQFSRNRKIFLPVLGLSFFIIFSFAMTQSQVAITLRNRFTRDLLMANQLTHRIESHKDYSSLRKNYKVFVIGKRSSFYPGERLFSLGVDTRERESIFELDHFSQFLKERMKIASPALRRVEFPRTGKYWFWHLDRSKKQIFLQAAELALQDGPEGSVRILEGDVYLFLNVPPWVRTLLRKDFTFLH